MQKKQVRTYDIINAGPKHRFMAEGRIVSNSGRTVQLQNLGSRGLLPQDQIEVGVMALKAGVEDLL
jgi:hypothetical protein